MRHTFNILLLFIAINAFGQKNKSLEINNVPNENYVDIVGTKVSLIPPPDFPLAKGFDGFQQEATSSSIMITILPTAVADILEAFTKATLKGKGMTLKNREACTVNGMLGAVLTVEQEAYCVVFEKYLLMFGDDENTIMINGIYQKSETKIAEAIKKAVLTAIYDPNKVEDVLGSVNYSIDITGTEFEYTKMMSNMLVYTTDGETPTMSEDKAIIVVGTAFSDVEVDDTRTYSINRIKTFPSIVDIEEVNEVHIDGMDGYEVVGYGADKKTGEDEMVYQVMLFDTESYYIFIGTCNKDFTKNLKRFKEIAKTFNRK